MTKIAALQMNSSADVKQNLPTAAELIADAALAGAKLIVLPEMFAIMGEKDSDKVIVAEKAGSGVIQDFLAQQAIQHEVWIVGGTIPLMTEDPTKVAAACLVYNAQGKVVARYDKIHLFDVNVSQQKYLESDTTQAGNKVVVVETPFGKLGLCVCYDIRFPELARALVQQGAEIIAIPTAFTQKTGEAHWQILMRALAIQTQCYVIGACETGQHANGRSTYGHSMIVDPWGRELARLEKSNGVITANIDLNFVAEVRTNMPLQQQRKLC
jgi:nitrilase